MVGIIALALVADAPFGPNVRVDDDNGAESQNETVMDAVYGGWNDYRSGSVWRDGYSHSTNNGSTWSANIMWNAGYEQHSGDPIAGTSPDGTWHIGWMDFSYSGSGTVVQTASTDGGGTWSPIYVISGNTSGLPDRPWMTWDGDTLLSTYAMFYTTQDGPWFSRVTAGGTTIDQRVYLGQAGGMPYIDVDGAGAYYIMFNNWGTIRVMRSTNYGTSWSGPWTVSAVNMTDDSRWREGLPYHFISWGAGQLGTVLADERFSTPRMWDILYFASTDGGQTWAAPVPVNDDTPSGAQQFMPFMCRDPYGNLHAAWYDSREGNWAIYYAFSLDDGATWSANLRVSDVNFAGEYFMGDYMSITADSSFVRVLWSDGRNGNQDAYYAAAPNPALGAEETLPPSYPLQLERRGDRLLLSVPAPGDAVVTLYDAAGRTAATLFSGTAEGGDYLLDLPRLPKGVYFAHARWGLSATTLKLVR